MRDPVDDSRTGPRVGLEALLRSIDGAPYPAYRRLRGSWELDGFRLVIDRVPPDPFAGPARMRLVATREAAAWRAATGDDPLARVAVEDWMGRRAQRALRGLLGPESRGPQGSRPVRVQEIGAAVIERSACRITADAIELRLLVELPARGRRVLGRRAADLLFADLPRLGSACLVLSRRAQEQARAAVRNAEDHLALQSQLEPRGLVAFLAEGSRLPRASGDGGDEDLPRCDGAEVPLEVPESLAVTIDLPHAGPTRGLAISAGVTLIVGGAFHGKSTLLEAIARGVHPHRDGDGRERIATLAAAVTIRAEDGRSVREVDISGFMDDLPSSTQSRRFTSDRASGSTSQAASISEAMEIGAKLLLLDEDRCATNFMVRDGRMQRLVPKADEPITPFIDRVRELYDRFGISTVLVTGGTGDYLEVADTVIRMKDYRPVDVTANARRIASETRSMRLSEPLRPLQIPRRRFPSLGEASGGSSSPRFAPRGSRAVGTGRETVDLRALEQLVETGQVRVLAHWLSRRVEHGGSSLRELVEQWEAWIDRVGLDALAPPAAYDLSRPRRFELAAAINRWRGARWERGS